MPAGDIAGPIRNKLASNSPTHRHAEGSVRSPNGERVGIASTVQAQTIGPLAPEPQSMSSDNLDRLTQLSEAEPQEDRPDGDSFERRCAPPPEPVFPYFTEIGEVRRMRYSRCITRPRFQAASSRWRIGTVRSPAAPSSRSILPGAWSSPGVQRPPGCASGLDDHDLTLGHEDGETLLKPCIPASQTSAGDDHATGWTKFLDRLAIAGPGSGPGADV